MTTNDVAGAKYGIHHLVLLQLIYSKNGAKLPGVLRGLLAGTLTFVNVCLDAYCHLDCSSLLIRVEERRYLIPFIEKSLP